MLSNRSSLAVAALTCALALAAVGCGKKKLGARVNGEVPAKEAAECTITQTQGTDEIEVCWDFTLECSNGEKVTAPHACHTVKDGGTERIADMQNVQACGGGKATAKVANLTIDGKKVE